MFKYLYSFILVPVMFVALTSSALAATPITYYNLNSESERVAYLYGIIAQLQAQLAALQNVRPLVNYTTYTSTQSSSYLDRVTTDEVTVEDYDEVEMSGRVYFDRSSDARAWFEYGTDMLLTYSTRSVELKGGSNDNEKFSAIAPDLNNNQVYYFRAVAEDRNGNYVEGPIKSFRFESSYRNNHSNSYYDRNNRYDYDWSLEIDDDRYDAGESIRVDYSLPNRDQDDKNWIGLFRVGASDKNYLDYRYIDDTEGYVTFRIHDEDDYEFRMFSNDSFNQEAETDTFEVID